MVPRIDTMEIPFSAQENRKTYMCFLINQSSFTALIFSIIALIIASKQHTNFVNLSSCECTLNNFAAEANVIDLKDSPFCNMVDTCQENTPFSTKIPSFSPTKMPTISPTQSPVSDDSDPTQSPTLKPTDYPIIAGVPTVSPTNPTRNPSISPTLPPSMYKI